MLLNQVKSTSKLSYFGPFHAIAYFLSDLFWYCIRSDLIIESNFKRLALNNIKISVYFAQNREVWFILHKIKWNVTTITYKTVDQLYERICLRDCCTFSTSQSILLVLYPYRFRSALDHCLFRLLLFHSCCFVVFIFLLQ